TGVRQDKKLFFLDANCFNMHTRNGCLNVNKLQLKQTVPLNFMYFIKTPSWLKRLFAGYCWQVNTGDKELYLTFDDGPHPVATPFVLEQLDRFDARASFFCLGKNRLLYPAIYQEILDKGHTVGNH